MKILGGSAKGMGLVPVKGMTTRPALARVRNSLFNILASRLEEARVLDLFAGTGSLGLETLSRGAVRAVFVDSDRGCGEAIRKSLEKMRLADRGEVLCGDVFRAAWRTGRGTNPGGAAPAAPPGFDLAFIDPPYAFYAVPPYADRMAALVESILAQDLGPDGRVILEHRMKEGLIREPSGGTLADRREYGQTVLSFYARSG
jgi:16S rRNA (guanine966-N2)-methyltransferase